MESTNLLMICAASFLAVFVILSILAAVMRVIVVLFPKAEDKSDIVMMAAIAAVAAQQFPDTRVTNVEEVK